MRFYALNAIDRASHRAGIEIVPDISDERVAAALVSLRERLGLPARLQLDNGGPFVAPKGLGLVVRLCLQQGVTPRFIPAREPWRNGTVEHFNDAFDKRFFRQERFASLAHLIERARDFETFHNANHRYRATNGRTPAESAGEGKPRRPRPLGELPPGWPATGRVEFVRFIRSDRKLRLLNRAITMPDTLVYEYVTAVLDLATQPADGKPARPARGRDRRDREHQDRRPMKTTPAAASPLAYGSLRSSGETHQGNETLAARSNPTRETKHWRL